MTDDKASANGSIDLLVRSTRPTNAYEETMERLLQSIRLGLIEPGQRLPSERDLAVMLKVSRDTVRDALATLSEQGFTYSRRGRYGGTFVVEELPTEKRTAPAPQISDRDVTSLATLRRILEVGAAREAAGRELRADERSALVDALEQCADAPPEVYRRLDSRLHLVIAECSGVPRLVSLVANVRTSVNELLEAFPRLEPNIQHSNAQHEAIVKAILSGQQERAAQAMLDHLNGSEALIRGFLLEHDPAAGQA